MTESRLRIGIDLGGTKTEIALIDLKNEIIRRERKPSPKQQGYDAIVENICSLVELIENDIGERCSVGIGTPGAISAKTGCMKNSNTLSLNKKPLKQDLEKQLDREIRMANDANCFALSEAIGGAGHAKSVVFGVILGTGVGGGVVTQGSVHAGPNAIAGEWGHNVLEEDGPTCYCGKNGCVESLLSGPALSADHVRHSGESIGAEDIVKLFRQGNTAATDTMNRYINRLGKALSVVAHILDPDVIVLGGGLSGIDELYERLPEATAPNVFSDSFATPIVKNHFGGSGGVRGAGMLWPV